MASFNHSLFDLIHGFAGRHFLIDDLGIFFAKYLPYLLVLAALYFIFRQPDLKKRLFLFCEAALALLLSRGILTEVIRFFYPQPRPFQALNFEPLILDTASSFPSGHAAFFFALALIIYYRNHSLGLLYFGLAFLNSIGRIFAGVHWPLDILGGAAVGILGGLVIRLLTEPYLKKLEPVDFPLQQKSA